VSFLNSLSTGLGVIGPFIPGVGTAVGIAAGVAGKLAGAPDALVLNPYPETWKLFEPEGLLWGVPLEPHEYELPGLLKIMVPGQVLGLQEAPAVAGQALASWRKTWGGTGGVELWMPSGGAWKRVTSSALKPATLPEILRVDQVNAILDDYIARRAKMLAGDSPVFHYLEQRTWAQAEQEYYRRTAKSAANPLLSHLVPPGPQSIVAWRKSPAAAQARAEHEAKLAAGNAAWEDAREHWRDWKLQMAYQAEQQIQVEGVSQAFEDYVAAAPPGTSITELVEGFANDFKPTVQHQGQKAVPLIPAGASVDGDVEFDEKPSSALVAVGLLGLVLLLLAEGE